MSEVSQRSDHQVGGIPLKLLVIAYASAKEGEMSVRGRIDDALRRHEIIADLTSQPKLLGTLKETVQMGERVAEKPFFRYEWRIRVTSPVDEATLQALRRELADLEVHDIHVENHKVMIPIERGLPRVAAFTLPIEFEVKPVRMTFSLWRSSPFMRSILLL